MQKKWEPPVATRVGKKKKRGPDPTNKRKLCPNPQAPTPTPPIARHGRLSSPLSPSHAAVPPVFPNTRCRLKLLKMERIKDHLLLEEEFIANQEALKPTLSEDKNVEDRTAVDTLRGSPMSVGSLEEIIDDDHALVSTGGGGDYYVSIMSFVDKDLLEPGCSVLLHNKAMAIVGVLQDDADPMVNTMKVDKAPTESYADIGGESRLRRIVARVTSSSEGEA